MPKINEIISKLSKKDIEVLKTIYQYRCVDENIIYKLHYQQNLKGEKLNITYTRRRLGVLKNLSLIEENVYSKNCISYSLTAFCIKVLKTILNFHSTVDIERNKINKGYFTASELKIKAKLLPHNIALNNFVVDFQLQAKISGKTFKYEDELRMKEYSSIRPDGLLIGNDFDFFLEMDLSTESEKQLYAKWDNYRQFIYSNEYINRNKKLIMLFIIDKNNEVSGRKNLIYKTLYERFIDLINSNFEIYVGTQSELLDIVFKDILDYPSQCKQDLVKTLEYIHTFSVSNGKCLSQYLKSCHFDFYINRTDDNKHVLIENGKIQEFIVDDFTNYPLSVLNKIIYFINTEEALKKNLGRKIDYLIVVKDEQQLTQLLAVLNIKPNIKIYFTTIARLKTLDFYEALFQINNGNLFHFKDTGLNARIFEISYK